MIFWAYHCTIHEKDACSQASDEETGDKEYSWNTSWLVRGLDTSNAPSFINDGVTNLKPSCIKYILRLKGYDAMIFN